ncbi:MAG: hypothetical protein F6K19_39810 [Cyanothece sp. SIO1E1]|nr:hypothetical protein [Cyanothece sp. SIO1E1]
MKRVNPNDHIDSLTKRELFAAIAMQGFLAAHVNGEYFAPGVTSEAVAIADMLIQKLNQTDRSTSSKNDQDDLDIPF